MSFDPYNHLLKIRESIKILIPKVGAHLGVWGVHSLTFSYTPRSMKCDSWAFFLAHTFAIPWLGREPKVRVVTCCLHNLDERQFVLLMKKKG